ncbi:MAG: hypothetical protein WBC78_07540 [Candidatus Sulfotelmatobacter sp.]
MNRKAKTFPGAAPIYLESDFYVKADTLRDQFEAQILGAADQNGGITSFSHAFCRDAFQFLTASAQSIFSADILDDVIGKLGSWATETLGTTSMSTPQTRLYIQGCSRGLLQDGIGEKWHYMLSICRNRKSSAGHIKLLAPDSSKDGIQRSVRVGRITNIRLDFNQLLVHSTGASYSIESPKNSMNPLDGVVFLDGYMW